MTAPRAAQALLFDFGGTLDADGIAWRDRFAKLFAAEGLLARADRFDRAFYDADDALVGNVPTELPLSDTVRRLSRDVAERLGVNGGLADRVAGRFLDDAGTRLAASAALLETLSRRFRLAVVSNFYGNLAAVCAGAGLAPHIAAAVDSTEVGALKPDPLIFEAGLAAVGVLPEAAIFVGDSLPRDMHGARRLGMRHVWLRSGDGNACCPGDPVIERLADLAGVLE